MVGIVDEEAGRTVITDADLVAGFPGLLRAPPFQWRVMGTDE